MDKKIKGLIMNPPFFGQYGDQVEFQSNSDLLEKFSHIDCSVPPRTQGRKSSHRERYCLKIYLEYLLQNNFLKFPLKIIKEKEDPPDFLITGYDGTTTALEHTDAGTEEQQCAMAKLAKSLPGTVGEPLSVNGWVGNEAGREWVGIILNAINKKIESLNGVCFKTADRYELLIFDNSSLSGMFFVEDALPLLKKVFFEKFPKTCFTKNFHVISVIHRDQLLYDIEQSPDEINVPDTSEGDR